MPKLPILVAALLAAAVGARAQPSPDPRNGDVRNGQDNEPSRGEVIGRERASGLLPPAGQRRDGNDTVERMYDRMMRREHQELGTPAPPPVAPVR